MRGFDYRRVFSLLVVAAMLLVGVPVAPAAAAGTFTGGVGTGTNKAPVYCPNDHTALGIHWKAEAGGGLAANTAYHVKVRFIVGTSPSPGSNRGFTWNGDSERWVQESEVWTEFPTVTTDSSGAIAERWEFVKFGDENISGEYRLMVSLNPDGTTTYNSSVSPIVTVIDMSTEGGWIHNATATGYEAAKPMEVFDAARTTPWTRTQTEENLVDDDSNGTLDDEGYGPDGATGDYRIAAPTDMSCDLLYRKTTVLADDWTHEYPDCDIAFGAADTTPPSAVGSLEVTSTDAEVTLDWDAATDAGSGVSAYRVYRWQVPEVAGKSTPLPEHVADVPAAQTVWTDVAITEQAQYAYSVRAVDADGNVGPRGMADLVVNLPAETDRVNGDDRYETAIEISMANFAESSVTTAVVATGLKFPDALAASGLAGVYGSPILLVNDVVTPELTAELDRLGATDVILIGGASAIPAAVESEFAKNYKVDRIGGADRYETAALVARRIADAGGSTEVFLARGDDFADALAASPFAFGQQMPVLLVAKGGVPAATAAVLKDLAVRDAVVIGGVAAVSESVYAGLDTLLAGNLDRWSGADRYATAVAVAQGAEFRLWGYWSFVGMATGRNFPDALGGGAAAGANGGILLLTAPDTLPEATRAALADYAEVVDNVQVFGGPAAVSEGVYAAIEAALE